MGPLEKSKPWNTKGLQGCSRFLNKIWRLVTDNLGNIESNSTNEDTLRLLHQTIKKVTEDLDSLRFNTSVSQLMIFVNHLTTLDKLDNKILNTFLILLNPFAPHISEELNSALGNKITIAKCDWPTWDESLSSDERITLVIQFNGKRRGEFKIEKGLKKPDILKKVKKEETFEKYSQNIEIIKEIYVENRLINFVVKPKE